MKDTMNVIYRGISDDYARVEKAILFLDGNYRDQPSLEELAAGVHLSKYHFQRMFSRWAGISPKRFMQFLTLNHAKQLLADSQSVLDAALDSGLSGPARLHDLFVAVEAMTPGEYKGRGEGVTIRYGWHPSPFGECLLALTDKGVCALSFAEPGGKAANLEALRRKWKKARLVLSRNDTRKAAAQLFAPRMGADSGPGRLLPPLHLHGTNFQVNVWRALMNIPPGAAVSYQDVARLIGKPNAARAVGRAVGENPIAYIIPCHRVIRRVGGFGDYRWGAARKKAMLAWEAAKLAS